MHSYKKKSHLKRRQSGNDLEIHSRSSKLLLLDTSHHFMLVTRRNNISILHRLRREITFAVYVTAREVKKSTFDNKVEITNRDVKFCTHIGHIKSCKLDDISPARLWSRDPFKCFVYPIAYTSRPSKGRDFKFCTLVCHVTY